MHLLGGVAGHSYYLAEKIGDVGMIFSPLHAPYIVAVGEVFKCEAEVFVLFIDFYGCYRAVFIFKADFVARIAGLYRIIIATKRFIVERQQRRRLVSRAEVTVVLRSVVHSGDISTGIDFDSEVVGL